MPYIVLFLSHNELLLEANMFKARIYKPSKTSMQSGRAKTAKWILEFTRKAPAIPDPLMGWQSCVDTQKQVTIPFSTKEAAIKYAENHSLDYQVVKSQTKKLNIKTYADNFSSERRIAWTH